VRPETFHSVRKRPVPGRTENAAGSSDGWIFNAPGAARTGATASAGEMRSTWRCCTLQNDDFAIIALRLLWKELTGEDYAPGDFDSSSVSLLRDDISDASVGLARSTFFAMATTTEKFRRPERGDAEPLMSFRLSALGHRPTAFRFDIANFSPMRFGFGLSKLTHFHHGRAKDISIAVGRDASRRTTGTGIICPLPAGSDIVFWPCIRTTLSVAGRRDTHCIYQALIVAIATRHARRG